MKKGSHRLKSTTSKTFGLVEFSDGSQAICPMKNVTQEGNLHIVKYKGAKYEASLLITNETREKLQEIQENGKKESESVKCGKKSEVSSPAPEFTPSLPHIRSPIDSSKVDDASSDASTSQHNAAIMPEIVVHDAGQKLQEIQNTSSTESNSVIKPTELLSDKRTISTYEEQLKNVSRKLFTEASPTESKFTVLLPDISSSVAIFTVEDIPFDALTDERDSTVVPETVSHSISWTPQEIENTLVNESDPVIEPKKQSYDKPKIVIIENISPKANMKLLKRSSLLIPGFGVPLSQIYAPVSDFINKSDKRASLENTSLDTSLCQQNSSSMSGTVIDKTNDSDESSPVRASYNTELNSGNILDENLLNDVEFLTTSHDSVTSLLTKSNYQPLDFDLSFNKFDEPSLNNSGLLAPEEISTSTPDAIVRNPNSNIGGNDANSIENKTRSARNNSGLLAPEEISTSTPDAIVRNPNSNIGGNDANSIENKTRSARNNSGLLAPEEISTSTPDAIVHNPNSNIGGNDANSIENKTRSARKLVFKVPSGTEALSNAELSDSDSDYKPEEQNSSDSASDAEISAVQNTSHREDKNNNSTKNTSNASSGFNITASDSISGSNGIDDDAMQVSKSRGRNGDKKLNFCLYCHKKQSKIARHLELKHKDEEDVKKFAVLPKKNQERRQIIDVIRKKGNFLFNTQSEYNDGELIVSRRPNTKFDRSARQFKACANCKAFFAVGSLRVHFGKCTGKSSKMTRHVMLMSKKVVRRIHSRATPKTRDLLFPPLREDEIVRLIRYDELVIVYANKMCQKYQDPRYYQMIRQRMRLLGRLLSTLRKLNKKITDLTSVYDPQYCDDVLEAINIEAKLGVACANNYKTPSVAFSLGTLLKQIGSILITECIKKHDEDKKKCVKDFLKLLAQEVTFTVNRTVEESQAQHNRQKKVELPSMEDIKKLNVYLIKKRNDAFKKLSVEFSEKEWLKLAESTLTSIQLFNRRRAGEIERTRIDDFEKHHGIDVDADKDLFKSLSKQSQEIAKKYVRFGIRGKLNRTVSVILDVRSLESIKLILHHRQNMKIKKQNPYVFGLRGGRKPYKFLRACALMRKFSVECGASNPLRLRGTKLRKHIATTCISLNLSENQVTDLANFMGHAEKIHKDIYRQPLRNREILQMSTLLKAMQGADDSEDDDDDDENEDADDDEELENHHPGPSSNRNVDQDTNEIHNPDDTDEIHNPDDTDEIHNPDDTDEIHNPDNPSKMSLKSKRKKFTGSIKRKRSTSPYGPVKHVPWNDDEKKSVLERFAANLKHKKLPSLKEIQTLINVTPCLSKRKPSTIKTWLHNQTRAKKQLQLEDNA